MKEESKVLREMGRMIVGIFYDYQETRKRARSRIRQILYRLNEGIDFDTPQAKKLPDEKAMGKKYNDKNLPGLIKTLHEEGKLLDYDKDYIEKALEAEHEMANYERLYKSMMDDYMRSSPIWYEYLENVRGISTVLAANLIKALGYCERYRHVSSVHRHFGLHVVCPECTEKVVGKDDKTIKRMVMVGRDGICPKCGARGIAPRPRAGVSIDYDPRLRTMAWKIADSFVKQRTQPYRRLYDDEKQKQLDLNYEPGVLQHQYRKNRDGSWKYKEDATKLKRGHADNKAKRKMVKIFLENYYVKVRIMKGLTVDKPYAIAHMGHNNYISPDESKSESEPVES